MVKGFIYLVEVAIAGFLLLMALGTAFAIGTAKTDWSVHDLSSTGLNAIEMLEGKKINISTLGYGKLIGDAIPNNMDYSAYVYGLPESMKIGCTECSSSDLAYAQSLLVGDALLNGRTIKFSVELSTLDNIDNYDAILLIDHSDFDNNDKIQKYIASGKRVVAIKKMDAASFNTMKNTFGLKINTVPMSTDFANINYNPEHDRIGQYFSGIGFEKQLTTDHMIESGIPPHYTLVVGGKQDNIVLWGSNLGLTVLYANPACVQIDCMSVTKCVGETFVLSGATCPAAPDSQTHEFKVKAIDAATYTVWLQPMEQSFVFSNFANDDDALARVMGRDSATDTILSSNGQYSMVINNHSAVWISDFPTSVNGISSEYKTIVKSSLLYENQWRLKDGGLGSSCSVNEDCRTGYQCASNICTAINPTTQSYPKKASISYFQSIYGDMPETANIILNLWYVY